MTSSNSTSALRHCKGKLLLDRFPCKIDSTAGLARTSTQQWIAFSVLRREFDALRYDSKMVTNMFHIKRMASSRLVSKCRGVAINELVAAQRHKSAELSVQTFIFLFLKNYIERLKSLHADNVVERSTCALRQKTEGR